MFMYGSVIREIVSLLSLIIAIVLHLKFVDGKKWGSRRDRILEQSFGLVFVVVFVVVWQMNGPDSYRLRYTAVVGGVGAGSYDSWGEVVGEVEVYYRG